MQSVVLDSILFIFVSTLVPLLCASAASLLIGFFQTLFQVQEQTLLFLVRMCTCVLVLLFVSSWCLNRFTELVAQCLTFIGNGGS